MTKANDTFDLQALSVGTGPYKPCIIHREAEFVLDMKFDDQEIAAGFAAIEMVKIGDKISSTLMTMLEQAGFTLDETIYVKPT